MLIEIYNLSSLLFLNIINLNFRILVRLAHLPGLQEMVLPDALTTTLIPCQYQSSSILPSWRNFLHPISHYFDSQRCIYFTKK